MCVCVLLRMTNTKCIATNLFLSVIVVVHFSCGTCTLPSFHLLIIILILVHTELLLPTTIFITISICSISKMVAPFPYLYRLSMCMANRKTKFLRVYGQRILKNTLWVNNGAHTYSTKKHGKTISIYLITANSMS